MLFPVANHWFVVTFAVILFFLASFIIHECLLWGFHLSASCSVISSSTVFDWLIMMLFTHSAMILLVLLCVIPCCQSDYQWCMVSSVVIFFCHYMIFIHCWYDSDCFWLISLICSSMMVMQSLLVVVSTYLLFRLVLCFIVLPLSSSDGSSVSSCDCALPAAPHVAFHGVIMLLCASSVAGHFMGPNIFILPLTFAMSVFHVSFVGCISCLLLQRYVAFSPLNMRWLSLLCITFLSSLFNDPICWKISVLCLDGNMISMMGVGLSWFLMLFE